MFSDIQKEQIINFGALGYPIEKISNIMDIKKEVLQCEIFEELYQKGKDTSDFVIDLKLFEMAKAGDIKALDKLNSRKKRYVNENDED